ncbi:MAG: serine hydrolase [Blastomonas sp.]
MKITNISVRAGVALMLASLAAAPAALLAQAASSEAVASDALKNRADDVLRLLNGEQIETEVFDANFLNAVPPSQFRALVDQIRTQHGAVQSMDSLTATDANSGTLKIRFEKSLATMLLSVRAEAPHRINGLRITGFEAASESMDEVLAAIDALPGRSSAGVFALSDSGVQPLAALDPDGRYAIGSAFKLYILAELDRAVRAGERSWDDVVSLGPISHPSGMAQDWPEGMPVTLQTLATLMIQISDNTATDTLIRVIGQERLAAIVRASGHSNPGDLAPFLMTQQAFALKMPAAQGLRDALASGDEAQQARLIADNAGKLTLAQIDIATMTGQPNHIDDIEWFASASDIARLMNLLRAAGPEARQIMGINPGIGKGNAAKWAYLGFKGGSEPGVMSLNFLTRSKSGQWHAISGHWNDGENALNEGEFLALMTRLVNLAAEL